jgi:hypothetical protein
LTAVDLLRDLYDLSEENRNFIDARIAGDASAIKPYLEAVENALYPDVHSNSRVQLGEARRAIAAYRRASRDETGTLELMLRFVECGTDFTADYGDIDERFYESLSSMFEEIVQTVESLASSKQASYVARLVRIVERAGAVGWGYQDHIAAVIHDAFSDIVEPRPDV